MHFSEESKCTIEIIRMSENVPKENLDSQPSSESAPLIQSSIQFSTKPSLDIYTQFSPDRTSVNSNKRKPDEELVSDEEGETEILNSFLLLPLRTKHHLT